MEFKQNYRHFVTTAAFPAVMKNNQDVVEINAAPPIAIEFTNPFRLKRGLWL